MPLIVIGDPDIPKNIPWASSRNDCGPVIWNITRSCPGKIASSRVPMTSMSKLVGVLPWTVVSPVPTIPGAICAAGRTAGGDRQVAAAGAGVEIDRLTTSTDEQMKASMARRRAAEPIVFTGTPLSAGSNPTLVDARKGKVV